MRAINGNFTFSYYIFGPYSPDVARMGFDLIIRENDSEIEVTGDFEDKIKDFFRIQTAGVGSDKWLELLATMHYIIYHMGIADKNEVFSTLVNHHEYFNNPQLLENAWNVLRTTFSF